MVIFQVLLCLWSFMVDLALVRRMGDREKDIEIVLLRQQLRIVERRQQRGPILERWEKLPLVALTARLRAETTHWRERLSVTLLLFQPDIELGTRRVYLAGITEHPDSAWVTQQARQLTWQLHTDRLGTEPLRFLIHDNDAKFSPAFDTVFVAENMEIIFTSAPGSAGQCLCRALGADRAHGMS